MLNKAEKQTLMIMLPILFIIIGIPVYGVMTGQDSVSLCEKEDGVYYRSANGGGVCLSKTAVLFED